MPATSATEATQAEALLLQPSAYPERPHAVETIETHISHVFLTDRFAYKLKKPVQFAFLDFSSSEKRRAACENEVRINRRLADDVYLGVLPINRSSHGRLSLGGRGTPIDWVVKMRRLPESRSLKHLIAIDRLQSRDVESLGRLMSAFYARQPPLTIQPVEYRSRTMQHVRSNWSDLLDTLPDSSSTINQLHSAMIRYLTLRPSAFDRRACDGRIVDGHGDLRPDHIYFVSPPVIIDGIEFSDELRQVDIVDELCFLAMECDRLERDDVGDAVLRHYIETTGDKPDPTIICFYKIYRACVRSKISMLAAAQSVDARLQHLATSEQYLQLGRQYLPQLGPRLLLAVTGLMGSGKSTLAHRLAESLGADLLQTDKFRRDQYGPSPQTLGYDEGIYRPELRRRVYRELLEEARDLLSQGNSVIMDGTFLKAADRAAAMDLARDFGATSVLVRCECPRDVAIHRLQSRPWDQAYSSEAHPQLFDAQAAELAAELPAHEREATLLRVDTLQPLDEQLNSVLDYVKTQCDR